MLELVICQLLDLDVTHFFNAAAIAENLECRGFGYTLHIFQFLVEVLVDIGLQVG